LFLNLAELLFGIELRSIIKYILVFSPSGHLLDVKNCS